MDELETESKYFHHEKKGCILKPELVSVNRERVSKMINLRCTVHDILCSKTGWEIGHWMYASDDTFKGRTVRTRKGYRSSAADKHEAVCAVCGSKYMTSAHNSRYCKDRECSLAAKRERERRYKEERKKNNAKLC